MTAILIYTAFCAWVALFVYGANAHLNLVRLLLFPVSIPLLSMAMLVVYVSSLGRMYVNIDWCDE